MVAQQHITRSQDETFRFKFRFSLLNLHHDIYVTVESSLLSDKLTPDRYQLLKTRIHGGGFESRVTTVRYALLQFATSDTKSLTREDIAKRLAASIVSDGLNDVNSVRLRYDNEICSVFVELSDEKTLDLILYGCQPNSISKNN